jgi:putative phosphoserine phosphatase/1-acylglycerol-3-phosphate O-acyltransferase
VAVLKPIPTETWTVEELDERIAQVRGLYLKTLDNWPRDLG